MKCRLMTLCPVVCCMAALAQAPAEEPELPKTIGQIHRLDPAFDELVPAGAEIEVLAGGFDWSEGPVWMRDGRFLLFSDIPRNHIVRFKDGKIDVFMQRSGYTGPRTFNGREPGTNGLTVDARGRLVMCEHGNRRVTRLEVDGSKTVLADRYRGKRFNSPNDLVYKSNGDLYFTDPPYGLPKNWNDPARELDWCGVYRLTPDGQVTLVVRDMSRPNGIGLSPDEKTLYVAQSDGTAAIWKAFPVREDGTVAPGRVFFDSTEWMGTRPGAPDGMAIDVAGNVWATGPGGVYVFSPEGKLLGRIATGQRTANCTFGEDGTTLFMTADMYLCRLKTTSRGLGWK